MTAAILILWHNIYHPACRESRMPHCQEANGTKCRESNAACRWSKSVVICLSFILLSGDDENTSNAYRAAWASSISRRYMSAFLPPTRALKHLTSSDVAGQSPIIDKLRAAQGAPRLGACLRETPRLSATNACTSTGPSSSLALAWQNNAWRIRSKIGVLCMPQYRHQLEKAIYPC